MVHLFPGFSGSITGIAVLLFLFALSHLLTPKGSRAGEYVVGIATGSIVLLVGAGLHSSGHLPWRYVSPLVLLTFCVIYGVLFMVMLAYNEIFLHGNEYTRFRYVRNQSLGFSSLTCFCAGYC